MPIVAKVGLAALIGVIVAAVSVTIRRHELLAVGLALAAVSFVRAYGM